MNHRAPSTTKPTVGSRLATIKRSEPQKVGPSTAAVPARAADERFLGQIISKRHPDLLEPQIADRIEAIMNANPGDAELQALAVRAINAYSDALLVATAHL